MDFTTLLDEANIHYYQEGEHHHCTPGRIQFDCPFCSPGSGKYRMGYHLEKKYCMCWGCGHHSAFETILTLTGKSRQESYLLAKDLQVVKLLDRPKVKGKLELPKGVGPLRKMHRDYLISRDYNPTELEGLWSIQGIGSAPKLRWRIFIPIHQDGEVVSWSTRSVVDDIKEKYIHARPEQESYPIKDCLYGIDYCRNCVVVVEGCFDVWRIGPGAIATMGIEYSKEQVERISRYPVRVICYDNEPQAQKQARKLCNELSVFPGQTYNVVLSGKDPDTSPDKEIRKLRKRFLD